MKRPEDRASREELTVDRAMTLPVEREKEKAARISPTALIRRSGLLAAAGVPELSDREREILERVASGRNNSEIAGELFLSLKTVQNHVSNIFRKLRVADRAQAVIRAREAGLGGDLTLS
jgi:DNA-binding NarL/FixJ family response regulator